MSRQTAEYVIGRDAVEKRRVRWLLDQEWLDLVETHDSR